MKLYPFGINNGTVLASTTEDGSEFFVVTKRLAFEFEEFMRRKLRGKNAELVEFRPPLTTMKTNFYRIVVS